MTSHAPKPVLVVGATGNLGHRVVRELLARGKHVRALVRDGTDASALQAQGVEIVRGDLTKAETLPPAIRGADSIVTTAIGYSHHKPQDSLQAVDIEGNRNLIDAAAQIGVRRFVLTSILQCHLARDVPHFWAKKLAEDRLEEKRVPFVALRPGAYLGGNPWWGQQIASGQMMSFGPSDIAWTYVLIDDVAALLAEAVDKPGIEGQRIDIGTDRAVTQRELAQLVSRAAKREVKLAEPQQGGNMPRWGRGTEQQAEESQRDMMAMVRFFATGKYVADTRRQREVFGRVPSIDESVQRAVDEATQAAPRSPA